MMALVQQWQAVTAQRLDLALFLPALALALIGYIMITSASMDVVAVQFNDPFYQSKRQLLFMFLGSITLLVCLITPVHVWQKQSPYLLLIALLLLVSRINSRFGKNRQRKYPLDSYWPIKFAALRVCQSCCCCFHGRLFSAPTRRSAK